MGARRIWERGEGVGKGVEEIIFTGAAEAGKVQQQVAGRGVAGRCGWCLTGSKRVREAAMMRKTYSQLAAEAAERIVEIMPWDVPDFMAAHPRALLLDIREHEEFARARIAEALNVPRGILESAAEWDYAETEPELVEARERPVVVICRSGNRSALAAEVLREIGFGDVRSVKLGVKGWNDADLPLVDGDGAALDGDDAVELVDPAVRDDQRRPTRL